VLTRKATCISLEDSYFLRVLPEVGEQALNEGMGANINERIAFLLGIPCFSHVPRNVLMPVAGNMISKTYKLGEYLTKAGDEPDGLFLIIKG